MGGAAKDAAEHLASLEDGRAVWLGRRPHRETRRGHPAFRNAARHRPPGSTATRPTPANLEAMTFPSSIRPAARQPRLADADIAGGNSSSAAPRDDGLGRTPCGLHGPRAGTIWASAVTGQIMGLEVFEAHDPERARAFHDLFRPCARDNDLYLTYVIVNPQLDRSKSTGEQGSDSPMLRIVDEDAEGVTVRGGKMLGTAAVLANEMFVAHLQPLKPDEEDYAVSFAVPMAARGLRLLARKSYEGRALSTFDDPLASRFRRE